MKLKIIVISIILLSVMIFVVGCSQIMENIGMVSPTDEEQLSPEKGGPPDGLVKVLIGFKQKPGPAQQAMVKGVGGQIKYTYHIVDAIAALIPEKAIDALQKNPNIRYVELDGLVQALDVELDNSWGVDRIDAEVVWTDYTGQGVNVAIIDSGIDNDHPDLSVKGGVNFISKPSWKIPDPDKWDDDYGHGTHVAGIVAALDNDIGVVGVAPGANLYALKVLDRTGKGYVSDVIAAIEWATSNDIQVINMSLGGGESDSLESACSSAYDNGNGLILIASAGNGGAVSYPAAYLSVIAVSATDSSDNLASFSSTGNEVELAAPGVDIYSTYKGGDYTTMSGTSMASPHVAGTVALVIAAGIGEVRTQLQSTAEDIGLPPTEQGYGLVDAAEAAGVETPSPDTGTIVGNVTDADTGLAIGGATVAVEGTTLSDTTDAYGDYTIYDVAVGDHTVTASAEGYASASKDVTVIENDTSIADFSLNPLPANGITMYVESITFSAKKAGKNLFLYTTVEVLLGDKSAVNGAKVYMTLTRNESGPSWDFVGDTGSDGTVKFTLVKAQPGDYIAKITSVLYTDYEWVDGVTTKSCKLDENGNITQQY